MNIKTDNPSFSEVAYEVKSQQKKSFSSRDSLPTSSYETDASVSKTVEQIDPTSNTSSKFTMPRKVTFDFNMSNTGKVIDTEETEAIEDYPLKFGSQDKPYKLPYSEIYDARHKLFQSGYESKKTFPTEFPRVPSSTFPMRETKKEKTNVSSETINKEKNTYDSGYHYEAPSNLIGVEVLALQGASIPSKTPSMPKGMLNVQDGYSGYTREKIQYANYFTAGN